MIPFVDLAFSKDPIALAVLHLSDPRYVPKEVFLVKPLVY